MNLLRSARISLAACLLLLLIGGFTGCASPGDRLNESDVYRAQDSVFRPMGE